MTKAEFTALKEMELRIEQLKLFREYLETFFSFKPFGLSVTMAVYNSHNKLEIPYLNGHGETMTKNPNDLDAKKILEYVDKLIKDLELQMPV